MYIKNKYILFSKYVACSYFLLLICAFVHNDVVIHLCHHVSYDNVFQ